jgi:hypothetical protein
MIKINIDKKKFELVEKKHWKWFKSNFDKNLETNNEGKFFYQKFNSDNNKYEKIEVINKNIIEFLEYISNTEILKIIVVGKLLNNIDEIKSIQYVTKEILKKFPDIFQEMIMKSVNSFLESQRNKMKNIKDINRNTSNEFIKARDEIKKFFNINKEILEYYIDDLDNIDFKINNIKLTEHKIINFGKSTFIKFKDRNMGVFSEFQEILAILFNYNLFVSEVREDDDYWGAYKFLKQLNVVTCPYCNRNYIQTYLDKDGMCRADIDHFYPKSKYPFLAVSLYNFIPSCHICNSSFKNDIDTFMIPHIYPYEEQFGKDVKFQTIPLNGNEFVKYLQGNSSNFKIVLDIQKSNIEDKAVNSNNTFKIEELYNFHKDYVQEIIKKVNIYNEARIIELLKLYPKLFENREVLLRTIYSNYLDENQLGNRPLAKLAEDIFQEFNIKIYKNSN